LGYFSKSLFATMERDDTKNTLNRTYYDTENEFHGMHAPPLDENIAGRALPGTLIPRSEHQLDHYFQEIQRLVEYLTRCIDRLKYLRRDEVHMFENSRRYFQDGTGENPLRAWEVRIHAILGMLRDIQEEASHDSHLIV
jgi:hypothetical protein